MYKAAMTLRENQALNEQLLKTRERDQLTGLGGLGCPLELQPCQLSRTKEPMSAIVYFPPTQKVGGVLLGRGDLWLTCRITAAGSQLHCLANFVSKENKQELQDFTTPSWPPCPEMLRPSRLESQVLSASAVL